MESGAVYRCTVSTRPANETAESEEYSPHEPLGMASQPNSVILISGQSAKISGQSAEIRSAEREEYSLHEPIGTKGRGGSARVVEVRVETRAVCLGISPPVAMLCLASGALAVSE